MKRLYKGIEPIIAVVILVAVTLVIAIGVIGWIMGWWGVFGATESIQIYPDSYIQGNTLSLHLKNTGSAAAVIYKIEVVGLATVGNVTRTLTPGQETTISTTLGQAGVPGTVYQVKIYTRAGNVYSASVQAR